ERRRFAERVQVLLLNRGRLIHCQPPSCVRVVPNRCLSVIGLSESVTGRAGRPPITGAVERRPLNHGFASTATAPAWAHSSSCLALPPLTPIAPISRPSRVTGTAPCPVISRLPAARLTPRSVGESAWA